MSLPFRLVFETVDPLAEPASDGVAGRAPEEEVLALLRRAIRIEPGEADYQFMLGDALSRAGRHGEAIAALEEAVQMAGANPAYRTALGMALLRCERFKEAFASLKEVLRLQPDDPRSWNALGASLVRLGRAKKAADAFRRALELDPTLPEVHSNLGIALWELGNPTEAMHAFQRAIRQRPAAAHHRHLGLALAALARHEEAVECFRESARLSPDTAEAQLELGDALFALGRDAEAEAAYERASIVAPGAVASRAHSHEALRTMLLNRVRGELEPEIRRGGAWTGLFILGEALAELLGALRSSARGLGKVVWLVLALAVAHAAWIFTPPYVNHYRFKDAVVAAARAPVSDDRDVLERLMHAVRQRGLDGHIREADFQIRTVPRWRSVSCVYRVPVRIFPGFTRTLRLSISVEEPFLASDPSRFL